MTELLGPDRFTRGCLDEPSDGPAGAPRDGELPVVDQASALALASLPGMGPARLAALLTTWSWAEAWRHVRDGDVLDAEHVAARMGSGARDLARRWARAAQRFDVDEMHRRFQTSGLGLALRDSPSYPAALVDDLEAPVMVFWRGRIEVLEGPRVAVVGTRSCTRYGHDCAWELGVELATAGVHVVSGLALGIDAAAHRGALSADGAEPIGVVGTGLDVVYPKANADLWGRVGRAGVLLSEAPPDAKPEPWRFPARNRIIAALADVVVVVESGRSGGSFYTVNEAIERDRPVLAVPGPVRSEASSGTNRLISEGCAPLCEIDDVFVALGCTPGARRAALDSRRAPSSDEQRVLDAFGWQPATFEQLLSRTGLGVSSLSVTIAELETAGWVVGVGTRFERVAVAGA